MTSFEQLLVGRVVAERYRVDEFLASGGMGAVFRCHDLRLEREVAFKVVTAPPGISREARGVLRARFLREAKTAASIAHPNVATVHDYGVDAELDLDFLVMELLAGDDLGARIAGGWRPAPEELAGILAQAADGLAAGHARGVVHRDVKPGNLFATGTGASARIKVLDFGIAQPGASGASTVTHLTGGGGNPRTPGFAAPEQEAGDPTTPATDVYALALTAVAALAGGSVADPAATLDALDREHPALAALLRRALDPDPARRFPDCAAMGDALRQLAPLTKPSPVRRQTNRAALVAMLAVVALGVALWAWSRPRAAPAPVETEAEAVAAARAVFREVNASAGRMTRRYNPNGQVMAYLDRSGVRKLVTRIPSGTSEMYFDRHGLRFASEPSTDTGGTVHRYYFTARGELARHDPPGAGARDDWDQRARALRAHAADASSKASAWPTKRCATCDSLP
ncbi:MAG TPA: serine/threonine-protein kinase [Longimicrobium sp.]